MRIQVLTNVEASVSATLEYRYNRSISTGDPEVGGCVHIDTNIFSRMICIFSLKYSLLVMPCRVMSGVDSFVSKDTQQTVSSFEGRKGPWSHLIWIPNDF